MNNGNVKRKTMGEFQNKLFDTENSILNDLKGEIYIGKSSEEKVIIFSKKIKRWHIDITDIVLGIILNLLVSILVMLILLRIILEV